MPRRARPASARASARDGGDRNRLTTEAYEAVKRAIVSGELRPRERLYESALARQFSMSRTPVREALQRLMSEGLVAAEPEGLSVATLSVEEIRGLEQVNRALQGLAAETAATTGSPGALDDLEGCMVRMETCAAAGDIEGWIAADREIHIRILKICRNTWLFKFHQQMEAIVSRVRHLALRSPGRLDTSTREHRAFVDAIRSRDGRAAREAMQYHIAQTEENLVRILETFVVPIQGQRF